jgi:hypothetical protein
MERVLPYALHVYSPDHSSGMAESSLLNKYPLALMKRFGREIF